MSSLHTCLSPHAVQLGTTTRRCQLLSARLAEDTLEGIYKRYTDIARLSKFAGGIGVAWHRVRSRAPDRGHERPTNGIVPLAEDARLPRSLRSIRGVGARARAASTSRAGTPTSRSSSSCATTPATMPPYPQPQPRQLDPRPVHGAGRDRTGSGPVRPQAGPRTRRPLSATSSSRYARLKKAGSTNAGPGPQLYSAMMRSAGRRPATVG